MERQVVLWTVVLCTGIGYWFYLNSKLEIDYNRHIQLTDRDTGARHKPSELLDLSKIIRHTPEYINSTNAIERLYDLAYYSAFENPFVIDQSYSRRKDLLVAGWPVANQTRCQLELNWITGQLHGQRQNYSSMRGQLGYELTNYMDSFGRPESGLYSGSIHWLGSHKKCLASRLNGGSIKTRYCIAKLRFKGWPERENMNPPTRIRVGSCLPESCDTLAYENSDLRPLINELSTLELGQPLKDSLQADALFCLPDERSPLRKLPMGGWIFLSLVGLWLLVVLAATVVYESFIRHRSSKPDKTPPTFVAITKDSKPSKENLMAANPIERISGSKSFLEEIVCAISIRNSIKAFKTNNFRVKYNQGELVRLNLGGLDCLKVIMTLCVVLSHAGYLGSTHMRSLGNRIEVVTSTSAYSFMSMAKCVDTFFVFFGLLATYSILKKFSHQLSSPAVWLSFNASVFARVGPMFMFVYWYSKLVSPYTNSGPWWDYGVDQLTVRGTCSSEPWWKSIPYLGCAGVPSVPSCNLPSWFIVSYAQIALLMPLITYLIHKLPNHIYKSALVGFLLMASAGSIGLRLAKQTSIREEGFTIYGGFLTDLLEKFESTGHLTTLGRLGSVAVGCYIGYLLWCYERAEIAALPALLASNYSLVISLLGMLAIILLPNIGHSIYLHTGGMATTVQFISSTVILIIVWPILVAIVTISLTTIYNHKVVARFLSHSFWHAFNRLGLCIFLIHWEVLYMVITGSEQAPSYGFNFDIVRFWAFGVFFSSVIAYFIHILIEAPLYNVCMITYRSLTTNTIPSSKQPHQHRQLGGSHENNSQA